MAKSNDEEFQKDYEEILKKVKSALSDSETIQKAIESKLNENDLEELMNLMREIMPRAVRNLGQIYQFLNKYGYKDNVEDIKKDFQSKGKESEEK